MASKLTRLQDSPQMFNHCRLGGVGLEDVEVLAGLGLTGRQARGYLAILKLGGGTVKSIADVSLVSRQEIYRLIDDLQQLGLVQKNITAPTTFTATPIAEVANLLLQQKSSELNLISQKVKQLTKKLSQNNLDVTLIGLKPCFGTVFENDRGKKYLEAIEETQHCIEAVTSWRRFKQLNIHFEIQLQNALKNGITLRIVTEKPPKYHLPKWITPALSKYPNFKLKTQLSPVDVAVAIFDHKTVAVAINPNSSLTKGPDLWTTNPAITVPCQAYFNAVWAQTRKLPAPKQSLILRL
jgi:sugar-specific transcriptional regulator TrmB